MAVTGVILFGYVVAHLLGNLQIYSPNREQINTTPPSCTIRRIAGCCGSRALFCCWRWCCTSWPPSSSGC